MRLFSFNKIWLTLSAALVTFSTTLTAQNLVLNPSFESVNTGSLQCSWYTTQAQFNNAINNWTCPTGGSTDIFHTSLATSCYCSPFSTNASSPGQQAPRTGNSYCNITVYGNGGCSPYREYIQGQLSSALVVGQTYEVEMWVSLADKMSVGVNNLGIKFSANPYTSTSMCVYNTTPDLNYTGPIILDKNNWVQILFCYTPTVAGLDNFIIGNFYSDAATTTAPASGNTTQTTIRYFVEDVRVQAVTGGTPNAGTNGIISMCPGAAPVNLFASLGGTPNTTGTWTGPSALGGGYLGTFNPAVNAPGTYTYTVNGGASICAGGGGSASATVQVSIGATSNATITPAGPFCAGNAPVTLSAVDPGGTWSGTGITDAVNGIFNPATAGPGTHTITYSIAGPCGATQTTNIVVNPNANATITPAGPFCVGAAAVNLSAVDPGGTWSGTGITNGASGTFNPATAGAGTHTITYSISGTCGATQTTNIVVNPNANATITPAGPFCAGNAAVNLSAVDPGGTWSGTGITNAASGTFNPATAGPGTHIITYSISGACGATQTTNIVVNPNANATVTAAGPFCTNAAPVNLSAVDPGGTWSGTGITNAASGTFNPVTAGAGTHTITYTIPGTCGDVQSTNIVVNPVANATITPAGPFCQSMTSVNLSAADPGGTWSGTGIVDAVNGIFNPSLAGAGTHTITYAISGPCGATQTTSITVTQNFNATITPAGPFCVNAVPQTLNAADPGGTWSGTGISDPVNGIFDPALAGAGTFVVTYTIPGQCGDTQTETIQILPMADASINAAGPYCALDAVQSLSAVNAGGMWSGTGITNPANGSFDPAVSGVGSFVITYTIGGACGDAQNATVQVLPNADATAIPAGPFCVGDAPAQLTAVNPGGTWSGIGILDPINGFFDPQLSGTGTFTITYTIAGTCGDMQDIHIDVLPQGDATIAAAGPFCTSDQALTLSAANPGGSWSGMGITDVNAGIFDPSVAGPGTHTVTYSLSGQCGDTQSMDIVVNTIDDATVLPAGPFCLGATPVTLSAASSGSWSGPGIVDPINGIFDPSTAGSGLQQILFVSNGPCPSNGQTQIEVLGTLNVQAFQDATICEGESLTLTASGSGGDGNLSYSWFDGNGNALGTGTSLTVTPGQTSDYIVNLQDGCTTPMAMDMVTVTVNPIPAISIQPLEIMGCAPMEVNFTNFSSPLGDQCNWSFGDGSSSSNCGAVSHLYENAGCFDVALEVTANGCSNTVIFPSLVCLSEYPIADFTFLPELADEFDPEYQFVNSSQFASAYNWDFGDGNHSTLENPLHMYPSEITEYEVCLIASNDFGCADTLCKPVAIIEGLIFYVPNSFTPDGDQYNQVFKPVFTSGFDPFDFQFFIYNRWGEIVWESHDASIGWDGTYNGKLVENGTYVWKAYFKRPQNDEKFVQSGHVNVLR